MACRSIRAGSIRASPPPMPSVTSRGAPRPRADGPTDPLSSGACMNAEDYRSHDAIGLADLVARKEVSETEVLDAALSRLDQVNGTLNAVITLVEDQARAAIAEGLPDGPLRGVPFLIKDLGMLMKGVKTGSGSHLFDWTPPAAVDSALVSAYRKGGLVLFGKTNTPEFG